MNSSEIDSEKPEQNEVESGNRDATQESRMENKPEIGNDEK